MMRQGSVRLPDADFFWIISMDGEGYWLLLSSSVSLLSDGTVQPENTYFCILKVTGQAEKAKKDKHQH